ncbi:MAG: beta-ketoacyl-ACP synthase II [Chitinivibrionales bacterium]|nr:beta-ketoacyl-ACP synthase II [Chitinivibrionales bacterium]
MSQRVVVTGLGVVSPVGNDIDTFWNSLINGVSGISELTAFDDSDYTCKIAGEVGEIDFTNYVETKEAKRTDRCILFSLVAADQAIRDANLDLASVDLNRCATIIGSGIGGLAFLENEHTKLVKRGPGRVSPFLIPMMISDMSAGRVSIKYGLKGINYAVVSACASGAHAIGDSYEYIKNGIMDMAVTGGTEAAITPLAYAGFCNMKAVSTRNKIPQKASSPFDKKRDGFVMGEGAGIVVLESLEHAQKRGAPIYGEIIGYGASGDAYHIAAPCVDGEGARRSMLMALERSGLAPGDIDYINAHGTATPDGDIAETIAIKAAFGKDAFSVAISSTKSMTGHLLGASGGIEFIASIKALCHGIIPPTINLDDADPECDLNYTPHTAVEKQLNYVLSNSFGFGGHNASLIAGKYEDSHSSV